MTEYLAPGVYIEEIPAHHAKASYEDINLPASELKKLEDFSSHLKQRLQFRNREDSLSPTLSSGIRALFAGPPGTGKTLAANILAAQLGLDLYKIDLSAIINKYIGETEKNLDKVFEQVAGFEGILFFDEADTLFGKRTEVKDAHDRYANIEVSYLLQRLESFDGIVILATNLNQDIDNAFIRQLHTVIEFPLPETPRRINIWARLWHWIKRRLMNKR